MASIASVRMVLIASVGRSVLIVGRTLSWCVCLLRCLGMRRACLLVLLIACGERTERLCRSRRRRHARLPAPLPQRRIERAPSADAARRAVASTFSVPDSHEVEWFDPGVEEGRARSDDLVLDVGDRSGSRRDPRRRHANAVLRAVRSDHADRRVDAGDRRHAEGRLRGHDHAARPRARSSRRRSRSTS